MDHHPKPPSTLSRTRASSDDFAANGIRAVEATSRRGACAMRPGRDFVYPAHEVKK
jgi:hypothetical protein